jgi:hypothetical protein
MIIAMACRTVSWRPYDQTPKPTAKSNAAMTALSPRLPNDSRSPTRAATNTKSERATSDTQSIADQLIADMATPPLANSGNTTIGSGKGFGRAQKFCRVTRDAIRTDHNRTPIPLDADTRTIRRASVCPHRPLMYAISVSPWKIEQFPSHR